MNDRVFDELVRTHEVAITTFARSLTRNLSSAEDALQETLADAQLDSCRTGLA